MDAWEDYITIKTSSEPKFENLGPASEYLASDQRKDLWNDLDYNSALARDIYPLPVTKDREGYYGTDHFSYWASGLKDTLLQLEMARKYNQTISSYLDLGCASGRVIRHFATQFPNIKTFGCDINRHHTEWCNLFLPKNLTVFNNSSIPSLPISSSSLCLISAYSVFTHIEAMETAWIMEIVRILRPGGLAWITVSTQETLHDMNEHWPLWRPIMNHPDKDKILDEKRSFSGNRAVFRYRGDRSYSSNTFYKADYIRKVWSRFADILEIRRRCPQFQDVVILQKPY